MSSWLHRRLLDIVYWISLLMVAVLAGWYGGGFGLEKLLVAVFAISQALVYVLDAEEWLKSVIALVSLVMLAVSLYVMRPEFAYLAQFIFLVPFLYAFSLRSPAVPVLSGLVLAGLIGTYDALSLSSKRSIIGGLAFVTIAYLLVACLVRILRRERAELYHASITDSLTGLYKLGHVMQWGRQLLKENRAITVYLIDMDGFKQINDTFGHPAGDRLLQAFAARLKAITAGINAMAGRLGGDEFVIVVGDSFDLTHSKECRDRLERLHQEMFAFEPGLDPVTLQWSLGEASSCPPHKRSIEWLFNEADRTMYYNKYDKYALAVIRPDFFSDDELAPYVRKYLYALQEKDMYTYIHSLYVAKYASGFAQSLELDAEVIANLWLAGLLHDIGKLLVPGYILRKPGQLTADEFDLVTMHVADGVGCLERLEVPSAVLEAVRFHHERWDGTGYPLGITGEDIPLVARILHLADAFSAMTIKRVYREPLSIEAGVGEILRNSGTQFDPSLVPLFVRFILSPKSLSLMQTDVK